MDFVKLERKAGRFLLVDGHAYAYRAFFAIRELSGPDGQPTNAILGFVKMLQKLQENLNPTHILVVWDAGLDSLRTQLLPEYKAQRPITPPSLDVQFTQIQDFLRASGVAGISVDGIEADDLIASYALAAASVQMDVVIASSDKDFMQLVGPNIRLSNPGDKRDRLWSETDVQEKTNVLPAQIVDYLSILGDSVDNIDGIPGVGPKTAAELLNTFGSIDAILNNIASIPSARIRAAIDTRRDILKRNRDLITLRSELSLPLAIADCRVGTPDMSELIGLYLRWGFNTMKRELESRVVTQPALL